MIGDTVKKLRESRNLNQTQLAHILGVSNTAMSQYESGKRGIDSDILIKISQYFKVTIDYLLDNNTSSFELNDKNIEEPQIPMLSESCTPYEYIEKIIYELKHKNRFFVENNFNYKLDLVCKTYEKTLAKKNTILYRARIYKEPDAIEKNRHPELYQNLNPYYGYDEKNSFVNKDLDKILDGRINPSGIPYLYTAFDIETAIKEVKPYANDTVVNIAEIQLLENINIIDLCTNAGWGNSHWESEFLMRICLCFSNPAYNRDDYFICQYISEYIKNKGYDGIAFLSAFTHYEQYLQTKKGKNLTIFNFDKCKAINSSLHFINNVYIDYSSFR